MTVRAYTQAIPSELREHLNKGIVLRREGRYAEAIEHHLAFVGAVRESHNKLLEAKFHLGLGNSYENDDQPDKARSHYYAALICAKSIEDRNEQGIAENNIAYLLIRQGRGDEAHKWLNEAEDSFRAAKQWTSLAQTQETRARLYQQEFAYRRSVKAICESTLTLIDGIEYQPLFESLTRAEQVIRAYRIQVALEMFPVAKAARHLGMSRQNLERILKSEFPELEVYARRGEPRGKNKKR